MRAMSVQGMIVWFGRCACSVPAVVHHEHTCNTLVFTGIVAHGW